MGHGVHELFQGASIEQGRRRTQHRSLGYSQRNCEKEETWARMEHKGPRPERAKNKELVTSPGTPRGRCAITRSQRPWHEWRRQKQGVQIHESGSVWGRREKQAWRRGGSV